MGWTGSFIWWNKHDTNKDLLLRAFPSREKLFKEGKIKLSQKGSDVFMLYQCDIPGEYFGKWFVCCYLCRREKGGEFMTKDIDAVSNHCFGFPKSWIDFLDKSDPEVQEYIKARELYENKMKSKTKFDFGDYVKCVAGYKITWNGGYKIEEDEIFYIHISVLNSWSKKKTKAYVVCEPHCNWKGNWEMTECMRRISGTTFKNCKSVEKLSENDIKKIVESKHQKVLEEAKNDFGVA